AGCRSTTADPSALPGQRLHPEAMDGADQLALGGHGVAGVRLVAAQPVRCRLRADRAGIEIGAPGGALDPEEPGGHFAAAALGGVSCRAAVVGGIRRRARVRADELAVVRLGAGDVGKRVGAVPGSAAHTADRERGGVAVLERVLDAALAVDEV